MIWIHIVFQFRWQLTSLVIADGTNIKTISLISKYKPIDFHYHGTETKQTIIEGTQGVLEGSALDAPGYARHHLSAGCANYACSAKEAFYWLPAALNLTAYAVVVARGMRTHLKSE